VRRGSADLHGLLERPADFPNVVAQWTFLIGSLGNYLIATAGVNWGFTASAPEPHRARIGCGLPPTPSAS
jgi:hypothetical protein